MAKTIKLNKNHSINAVTYKKGDVLSVSTSIYNTLKKEGIADEFKPKKVSAKKASTKKEETKKEETK